MIKYKIDKSQEIIFATITKSISTEEIMSHIIDIMKDPDFFHSYHSIITIDDNLIIPQVNPEKIPILKMVINGYARMREGTKWAVVSSNGTTHAIVKTALDLIGPLSANICLFDDRNKAIAWIKD